MRCAEQLGGARQRFRQRPATGAPQHIASVIDCGDPVRDIPTRSVNKLKLVVAACLLLATLASYVRDFAQLMATRHLSSGLPTDPVDASILDQVMRANRWWRIGNCREIATPKAGYVLINPFGRSVACRQSISTNPVTVATRHYERP